MNKIKKVALISGITRRDDSFLAEFLNAGTGKEVSVRQLTEMIMKEIQFKGNLHWHSFNPDCTMRKLTDVSKLHSLGWHHKVEIDEGIYRLNGI